MSRPKSITKEEFKAKLELLKKVLQREEYQGIYLQSEGAMRWLTGRRHQVVDIHPGSSTTVHCLVNIDNQATTLHFFSQPWEQNRLHGWIRDEIYSIEGIKVETSTLDQLVEQEGVLFPTHTDYKEIEREIVSTLPQHLEGNQIEKLHYLVLFIGIKTIM
mgnify:CR=1 FL=1